MSWFSKKKKKKECPSSHKKKDANVLQFEKKKKAKPKEYTKEDGVRDKQEIEAYIEHINKKLKDPAMAKKAAAIVTELLKKNG